MLLSPTIGLSCCTIDILFLLAARLGPQAFLNSTSGITARRLPNFNFTFRKEQWELALIHYSCAHACLLHRGRS